MSIKSFRVPSLLVALVACALAGACGSSTQERGASSPVSQETRSSEPKSSSGSSRASNPSQQVTIAQAKKADSTDDCEGLVDTAEVRKSLGAKVKQENKPIGPGAPSGCSWSGGSVTDGGTVSVSIDVSLDDVALNGADGQVRETMLSGNFARSVTRNDSMDQECEFDVRLNDKRAIQIGSTLAVTVGQGTDINGARPLDKDLCGVAKKLAGVAFERLPDA